MARCILAYCPHSNHVRSSLFFPPAIVSQDVFVSNSKTVATDMSTAKSTRYVSRAHCQRSPATKLKRCGTRSKRRMPTGVAEWRESAGKCRSCFACCHQRAAASVTRHARDRCPRLLTPCLLPQSTSRSSPSDPCCLSNMQTPTLDTVCRPLSRIQHQSFMLSHPVDPAKPPPVKFQEIVRDGQATIVSNYLSYIGAI